MGFILLDVKSKELGLFPQSSKIVIHEVTNIDNEIKRISKPLFDDEFDDEKNAEIAVKAIQKMLKDDPADLTTIKRYFRYVKRIQDLTNWLFLQFESSPI